MNKSTINKKAEVSAMNEPIECPKCGANAVEPCHQEPKVDCVRDDKK